MSLSTLPPEVLLLITDHVLASDLAALELCGNTRLNHTLFHQHSIETFRYHPSRPGHMRIPSMLARVTHLKELSFKSMFGSFKSQLTGLDLKTLPHTLETLELCSDNAGKLLEEAVQSWPGEKPFLPGLRRLIVVSTQVLRLGVWTTTIRFPEQVEEVCLPTLGTNTTFAQKLPSSLKSLKIAEGHLPNDFLPLLQDSALRSLSCPGITPRSLAIATVLPLPQTLTDLEFTVASFSSSPALLPRGLTSLKAPRWDIPSQESVLSLPNGLLHLVIGQCSAFCDATVLNLPRSLRTLAIETHSIIRPTMDAWPPGLTKLKLSGKEWTDALLGTLPRTLAEMDLPGLSSCTSAFPSQLPPSLTLASFPSVWQLTAFNISHFPRTLTYLDLKYNQKVKDSGISSLPRTLTFLNMSWNALLTDDCSADFPPNLQTLMLNSVTKFTDKAIANLPRQLTHLTLNSAALLSGSSFMHLPRTLTELYLSKTNAVTDSSIRHLPRGLRDLNLNSASHLTNSCVASFPRSLTILKMTWNANISDAAMPHMPKGLTELDLASSSRITVAGLPSLPPCLTRLAVASVFSPSAHVRSLLPPQLDDFVFRP